MISVLVTERPDSNLNCPFYNDTICRLRGAKCECEAYCGHLKTIEEYMDEQSKDN